MRRITAALVLAAGCGGGLPESDAPGAVVLQNRCGGCHPVHIPGTMTIAMWEAKLDAMRRLFAKERLPWLTPAEERALLDYLHRHAGRS